MGLPSDDRCGESEGIRTDLAPSFTIGPKNEAGYAAQLADEGLKSWFVCENRIQLRNIVEDFPSLYQRDSFRHLATERPNDFEAEQDCEKLETEFWLEEEATTEDSNNIEDSSPATQVHFELNGISRQTVSSSAQPNHIEAEFRHQNMVEIILKVAPAQELFTRKLSKTWKQECNTYDDLNRNVPSLSPDGDQLQNFASSGFVKAILDHTRKKFNMILDISGIKTQATDFEEQCVQQASISTNERVGENCSSPKDVTVTVNNHHKVPAISKRQKKVATLQSKPTKKKHNKMKQKGQKGLKASLLSQSKKKEEQKKKQKKVEAAGPKCSQKKLCSTVKGKQKRRQKKHCGSSRLGGSRSTPQTTKPREQGTSPDRKKWRHMSESDLYDEPHDADGSSRQQWHSESPAKQGNSDGKGHKNGGRGSLRGRRAIDQGDNDKDDDKAPPPPPGKDQESQVAALQQQKEGKCAKKNTVRRLCSQVPLHQDMPPEEVRDEAGDHSPSEFNFKPPPNSDQLSASSGFSANAGSSSDAMLNNSRKQLQESYRQRQEDSGFSSGPSLPAQPLEQGALHIARREPAPPTYPESAWFHTIVNESHGLVGRNGTGGTGGTVSVDSTFAPEFQQLASLHSHSLLLKVKSGVAPPYNSLEFFDRENEQQDNVLGSFCTPFVSPAGQHLQLPGAHFVREDSSGAVNGGLLDFQQYPTEESGNQSTDGTEMVGCRAPFLPPSVVCCSPSQHEPNVVPVNALTVHVLSSANYESRIVEALPDSSDLWTFTAQT